MLLLLLLLLLLLFLLLVQLLHVAMQCPFVPPEEQRYGHRDW
jgi:hypothetical protein